MSFTSVFPCVKIVIFWYIFHRNLIPNIQLITNQHWFRKWIGAEQTIRHNLYQRWSDLPTRKNVTRFRWIKDYTTLPSDVWAHIAAFGTFTIYHLYDMWRSGSPDAPTALIRVCDSAVQLIARYPNVWRNGSVNTKGFVLLCSVVAIASPFIGWMFISFRMTEIA